MTQEQLRAPLFEALVEYATRTRAPFHTPGHKMGRAAPEELRRAIGELGLSLDQTEAPGLDDLHAPEGAIGEAQRLAAKAFGAAHSFFLVGGSTAGLHALILSAASPGATIAVPRHAHRSVVGALILSGAVPAWMRVAFHDELDIATHVDSTTLEDALDGAAAAILVHPTFYGITGCIAQQIAMIHRQGAIALVDEAHGTHFAFHPDLPPAALDLGADGVVQSVHKTGGSLTQSSLCHLGRNSRLSPQRLREMLRLVQTTSPSYLLMASLDLARRDLYRFGHNRWAQALELARDVRYRLSALRGIRVHGADDPTKILIDVRGRGLTGFQAAEALWRSGVAVESAGLGYVLAMLTPGDSRETIDTLVGVVNALPEGPGAAPRPPDPPWPDVVITPREAYLGPKESVPLSTSVGRIAAELVAPYPPGIPVVVPGERLSSDVVTYLKQAVDAGYHLQGPADPHLKTIQVIRE